ncbi:putative ABC transporter A, ABCA, P-loop containing nucleoside triphosphate hydrolase [Rosa chinensis]|uniref:Putative ABC transporter A, ABCA, P-loop containing nucleoside triphosphate hydrolase n=1 Tax=Rosa chinensis TaxID=74649 RepID=A0A2P6RFG3_ROSCH|nr:putative ABC transporter A, ABCA, P-loop containing nucleoside triphosphate hydrolase [Rosa chinensis]
MLGHNFAGKTSFINMMIGLTKSTFGTAFVQGLDINTRMKYILAWESVHSMTYYGKP